jgi:hypothetical protein
VCRVGVNVYMKEKAKKFSFKSGVIFFKFGEGKEPLKLVFRESFVKYVAYLFEPINENIRKKKKKRNVSYLIPLQHWQ